jgi:cob(I)alamin adenosyltransferase
MDTKAKKRLEVINKKLQQLRPRLAGAKKQNDDPKELAALEQEVAALEKESEKLRAS